MPVLEVLLDSQMARLCKAFFEKRQKMLKLQSLA